MAENTFQYLLAGGVAITVGLASFFAGKTLYEPRTTKREAEKIFKDVEDPEIKKAWSILKSERDELLAQVEEGAEKAKKIISEIKMEREELLAQLLDKADQWTLTYFDEKGRAEQIRLLFAECGVPFTDVRLTDREWAEQKSQVPTGALPILSHNGKNYGESLAELILVAKLYDRWPKKPEDEAVAFSIISVAEDLRTKYFAAASASPSDKPSKLYALRQLLRDKLPFLEKFVDSGFVASHRLTAADIALWDVFDQIHDLDPEETEDAFKHFPLLTGWRKRVSELPNIAKYIQTRK